MEDYRFPSFCISLIPLSQYCKLFLPKIDSQRCTQSFSVAPKEPTRFHKTSRVDLRTHDCQRNDINFAICNKRHNLHRHKQVRRETRNVHIGSECLFQLQMIPTDTKDLCCRRMKTSYFFAAIFRVECSSWCYTTAPSSGVTAHPSPSEGVKSVSSPSLN